MSYATLSPIHLCIYTTLCDKVSTVEWSIGRQEQLVLSASWDSTLRLVSAPETETKPKIHNRDSSLCKTVVGLFSNSLYLFVSL